MGVIFDKNAKWELIHEAYGIRLEGKFAGYESVFSPEIRRCITDISVNGRQFYLGNNCIYAEDKTGQYINMDADKDILCWYFAHLDKEMDDWEYEHFWLKEYHNAFWKHRALQRKQREAEQERNRIAAEEREAERQKVIADFQAYANKKKLRMIIADDNAYFIKINKRIHKNADEAADDLVLMFAKEHPGNGVEIVETREVG